MPELQTENAAELARRFKALVRAGKVEEALDVQRLLWRTAPGIAPADARDVPLLPWEVDFDPPEHSRYLFVSGAPRSGTTALGRLLNCHADMALYIEAYSALWGYNPRMFARRNIERLRDLGILSTLANHQNADILERATGAAVVGDKRPNFMSSAFLTLPHFAGQEVAIVHVVRGVYEVAASYMARAARGSWAASRDHRVAVDELNLNNRTALALLADPSFKESLVVLDYDRFWADRFEADRLFERLGLPADKVGRQGVDHFYAIANQVAPRRDTLPDDVIQHIDEHFDFEAEAQLLALHQ